DVTRDPTRELAARQAAQWLVEQTQGPLSPQRERDFMQWLRLSPLHLDEHPRMSALEQQLGDAMQLGTTPLDQLVDEARTTPEVTPMTGRMARPEPRSRRKPAQVRRRAWTWVAACMAVAAVMAAG